MFLVTLFALPIGTKVLDYGIAVQDNAYKLLQAIIRQFYVLPFITSQVTNCSSNRM